jgi:hypothetical protein
VKQVDVEMVDPQPPEARAARGVQLLTPERAGLRVGLRRDQRALRQVADRLADHRLVGGVVVPLGGVDPVRARRQRGLDGSARRRDVRRQPSQLISAETDAGHAHSACSQRPALHGGDST